MHEYEENRAENGPEAIGAVAYGVAQGEIFAKGKDCDDGCGEGYDGDGSEEDDCNHGGDEDGGGDYAFPGH